MRLYNELPDENLDQVKFIANPKLVTHLENPPRTAFNPDNPNHHRVEDDYYTVDSVGDPIAFPGPEFNYTINRDGFRSQHFRELTQDNINVLYGGCSWTFGEGLPEDYTWVRLLTDKIDTLHPDKKACYYNTGFMGSSIQLIVKNIIGFCKTYGNPDYIFICFPDIARSIYWSTYNEKYVKMFPNVNQFRTKMGPDQLEYSKNYIHENNVLIAADYIRYLEDYCSLNGIKLLWNSWHDQDHRTLANLEFNNCISEYHYETWRPTYWDNTHPFPHDNVKSLPYWQISRDDAHPGTCWTTNQAEIFFREVMKRWF